VEHTVLLEELTWPEVRDLIQRGVRTVVIVAASIEQHGPHLPMVTDTAIGQVVGERLARKLGNALLAPPIRPACSDHHLAFPGSLSIPQETFIETVVAYVRSLAPHGFDTFVLFSSHGGNFAPLEAAGKRLQEEFDNTGVRIVTFAGLPALQEMMRVMVDTAAELGAPQDVDAIHADVTETSIMMARYPHLVAADRLEPGYLGRVEAGEIFTRGMRAITPNGVFGDPRRASAEIGNAVIERLTSHLADFVRRRLEPGRR
jgi:creatinine amidohydrolase